MAVSALERLYYTGVEEADELIARDPFALLMGFALDQQVPVPTAFQGPWKLSSGSGRSIPARSPPPTRRGWRSSSARSRRSPFPGAMAGRVQELAAHVAEDYGGDASRLWREAPDGIELRKRISGLPGFGDMKVKALGAVLWKRFGVPAAEELDPGHPTLGDVDSPRRSRSTRRRSAVQGEDAR